jgi:hypothetical protein
MKSVVKRVAKIALPSWHREQLSSTLRPHWNRRFDRADDAAAK